MEKEILEGNKLIAIFMGGKLLMNNIYNFPVSFGYKESYDEGGYIGSGKSSVWDIDEMEYHTSWDWLMPVWYKFRDLKFTEETPQKLHNNYVARLAQDIAYGTIEEFFHNIQIAINWYNLFGSVYNSTQKP